MHPRKLLFEFGTRDFDYICRSCLSTSQKRALPARTRWPGSIREASSHAAKAPSKQSHNPPTDIAADQEAERRKILETLGLLNNEKQHATINFFEQGDFGKLRRLDDRDDFQTSLVDPGGVVDNRLKQLEQHLEQAKLLVNKLEKIAREVEQKNEAHDHPRTMTSQDTIRENRFSISTIGWRHNKDFMIGDLNRVIQRAAHQLSKGGVKIKTMNRLWGDYIRVRHALATRWDTVPRATWELLWNVFSAESKDNPNRMSRVYLISKDRQSAGVPLTDAQQLLAIEAMFLDGWENEAIKNHTRLISTLGTNPETFVDFWQLGLRMYCLMGNIDQAQKIVDKIIEAPYQKDQRILLPFIRACAADPATVETGYKAYRKLRTLLGDSMRIGDYDDIIAAFLASNQTEHALYIFVDMMTSGAIDLREHRRLPPTVANPFFFGKWVKRLILGGDLKGAWNVLLYMKEKNIPPRPIQVNALLGAWLRSETEDNVRWAEEVGWAMVNSRIQFVVSRKVMLRLEHHIQLQRVGDGWPSANLETFKLLAENYKDRKLHSKMETLWTAFREAELAPDTFMMNQLLFSYLQNGQGASVTELSRDFNKRYNIKPDPWTFMALWQSLPVNRMWIVPKNDFPDERVRGRALFADMVESASIFADSVDVHFAGKVLHTFRKAKDTVGLLAAVRAFRHLFNFLPTEALILELLLGTIDLEKALKTPAHKDRLLTHTRRIEHYLNHRRRELVRAGELQKDDGLSEAMKREEVCNFFELHLETECQKSPLYPEGWELALRRVVEDMGLYKEQENEVTAVAARSSQET